MLSGYSFDVANSGIATASGNTQYWNRSAAGTESVMLSPYTDNSAVAPSG